MQKKILAEPVRTPTYKPADIRWEAVISRGVNGTVGVKLAWSDAEKGFIVSRMTVAAVVRCSTQMRRGDVVVSVDGIVLSQNDDTDLLLQSSGDRPVRFVLRVPLVTPTVSLTVASPPRRVSSDLIDIVRKSQDPTVVSSLVPPCSSLSRHDALNTPVWAGWVSSTELAGGASLRTVRV